MKNPHGSLGDRLTPIYVINMIPSYAIHRCLGFLKLLDWET